MSFEFADMHAHSNGHQRHWCTATVTWWYNAQELYRRVQLWSCNGVATHTTSTETHANTYALTLLPMRNAACITVCVCIHARTFRCRVQLLLLFTRDRELSTHTHSSSVWRVIASREFILETQTSFQCVSVCACNCARVFVIVSPMCTPPGILIVLAHNTRERVRACVRALCNSDATAHARVQQTRIWRHVFRRQAAQTTPAVAIGHCTSTPGMWPVVPTRKRFEFNRTPLCFCPGTKIMYIISLVAALGHTERKCAYAPDGRLVIVNNLCACIRN